jgi:hypothetical protein
MKWLALAVLAVSAIGCCCNTPGQPPVDPFYGRMTVPAPPTGAIAPQGAPAPYYPGAPPGGPAPLQPPPQAPANPPYQYQYQAPPPGGPSPLQPMPQAPGTPPYQYQAPPPGGPAPLQPVPQPGAAMPNPGSNNWLNSRPGTSTSWTGQSPAGPGDVITIPVSEGAVPLGPAVGPAADGRGP